MPPYPHIEGAKAKAITAAINSSHSVLIAWGISNPETERQEATLRILKKTGQRDIYKTKKHPSRGCYKDFIAPYNLEAEDEREPTALQQVSKSLTHN